MLLRENKPLASAILDFGEQMQKMEQMLRDFCQKYAPINNPQSEVETRIDEFLTGVRNASNMGSAEKLQSAAPFAGAQPASCFPQVYPHHPSSLASTHTPSHSILLCHSPLLSRPVPLLPGPPILQGLLNHPPLLCRLPPQHPHLPVW